MKFIFFVLLFSSIFLSNAFSQVGNAGMQFLKLGVSARSIGMGDATVAVGYGPAAGYNNPALLSNDTRSSFELAHKSGIGDTKIDFLGAKTALNNTAYAIFINTASIPNIEVRTNPGPPDGTFDVHYFAIGLTGAYQVANDFSLGVSGKVLYEKILIDDATGFALDLGGRKVLENKLALGASITNIGSMSVLRNAPTKLPTTARIGGSYPLALPDMKAEILIAADAVDVVPEETFHIHSGAEFMYDKLLAFRLGIKTGYDAKKFFSAGLGITYNNIIFDYAFVPSNYDFEPEHTIAVSYMFE